MFTSRIFEYIWPDFGVIKRTIVIWLSSSFTWVRSSVWSTPAPSLRTQPESKAQTTWSPSTRTDRQQGRDHKPTYRRSQEEGREASQALLKQNKRLRRWKMSRKSKLSCTNWQTKETSGGPLKLADGTWHRGGGWHVLSTTHLFNLKSFVRVTT